MNTELPDRSGAVILATKNDSTVVTTWALHRGQWQAADGSAALPKELHLIRVLLPGVVGVQRW